ncbi:amino acid ABC transporter permease [Arthrobacter sp. ok362]|jgi:glutamate transport system permease protein|uniref:amino acid ABC transporter permease n=1 Tax=Arthrobacter sp. ok362 TaxID=1761745 RepID=UPI0008896057|nr:amino acid ABC transporter permease [Arthrobacter sp. ok362]SDK62567.1 glutamate transport system permease protein [Arthrobacter sp. ok362]
MSTVSLFDPAGPRAKRRHLLLEVITGLVVLAGVYVVFKLLYDKGELSAAAWAPFAEPGLWALLGQGLWNNIAAALVGMVLSLITGCLLAFGLVSTRTLIRRICRVYTDVFSSIPLLLLLYFTSLVLPNYGFKLGDFWFLVIALTLYSGAVIGDLLRSGILALPPGQAEASLALGFSHVGTLRLVLLPQALRSMSPALVSQLIILFKGTALAFVLGGYMELLRSATVIGQYYTRSLLQAQFVAALGFLIVNIALGALAVALERRQNRLTVREPLPATAADPAPEPAHR